MTIWSPDQTENEWRALVGGAGDESPGNKVKGRLLPMAVIMAPALLAAVCAPAAFLPALVRWCKLKPVLNPS